MAAFLVLGVLLLSPAAVAEAQERSSPTQTREWSDHHGHDPGVTLGTFPHDAAVDSVSEDLQKIVVLCATEPDSPELDRAWAEYLRDNYEPGLDVDELIDEVLWRSDLYVGFGDGLRGARLPRAVVDHGEMRERLGAVAAEVIPTLR